MTEAEFMQRVRQDLPELEARLSAMTPEARRGARLLLLETFKYGKPISMAYLRPALSFHDYVRQAWDHVDPAPFVDNWHIGAICEHLQAVTEGQIQNLIINVPPRSSKSLLMSVLWPTWIWTFRPSCKFLFASWSSELSAQHSWQARQLLQTPWYRREWGHMFRILSDANQKTKYDNDRLGWRHSISVNSAGTGFGGDIVAVDDPNDARYVEQAVARHVVTDWYDRVMYLRLNNRITGSRVITQQRLHMEDLTGHVLAKYPENWVRLIIPMEFEPSRRCVSFYSPESGKIKSLLPAVERTGVPVPDLPEGASVFWQDPREAAGDLLCPERFPAEVVENDKKTLGEYGAAGQLQQRPSPAGGGLFKREWFKIAELPPRKPEAVVRFWDVAGTEPAPGQDADWTVGTRMSKQGPDYFIEHVIRGRWSSAGVDTVMQQAAKLDGGTVSIREEQEGGSSGKAVVEARLVTLSGYDYEAIPSTGSKVIRARPFSVQAEGGHVFLVRGEWNETWLDEFSMFPRGKHDDQVDSASGAFNELLKLMNIGVF